MLRKQNKTLKVRAAAMDEWIRGITNISSKVQYANIKGQGVTRGLQYQTAQCVNCRECSHLQRHYDQATKGLRSQNLIVGMMVICNKIVNKVSLRKFFFLNINQKEGLGF